MRQGVLLMAYGTPERIEDVEAYYTHIRRGRVPPPELLADLVSRYEAVGGPTALNRITRAQAEGVAGALARRGHEVRVYVGFKHVAPFIGDAVARMASEGIERAVGLVLAPHYSLRSIAEYERYARDQLPPSLALDVVRSWHDDPALIAWLANALRDALARSGGGATVLFTAHSVPEDPTGRDPYAEELRRTCELVAANADVEEWEFAFQSAGRTADRWLGPDVLNAIDGIARRGRREIIIQAIGFVADHLETLYDLDVEARRAAESRGLAFTRAAMPNDDPAFIEVLAGIVESRL